MACSHLLFHNPSSRSLRIYRRSAYFLTSIRPDRAEKAYERLREECERLKEAKARQGFVSQTIEKASDGAEEAVPGETRVETVKERYRETVGKGNFHKPRDE